MTDISGRMSGSPLIETLKKTCSGIFPMRRYTRITRHLVAIGIHAEKEVIQ
jgi:hypothetical protein